MDEEREEGGPTSKTILSEEHGRQRKVKSPEQQERADSPGPSCVSMKSDRSMDKPVNFKDGNQSVEERQNQERSKVASAHSVQQNQTELIKGLVENGEKCFHSPIIILCACGAFHLGVKELSGYHKLSIYMFGAGQIQEGPHFLCPLFVSKKFHSLGHVKPVIP
ncbi:unnamed protein product [Boreogadus saida]